MADNRTAPRMGQQLDLLIRRATIIVEPVTEVQVAIARQARRR